MTEGRALVVGGGGFLGSAVARELTGRGVRVVVPRVPWQDPEAAAEVIRHELDRLRTAGAPWRFVWCAGTGIVSSDGDAFATERALLDHVLDPTTDTVPGAGPAADAPGVAFFASSAGAVYAGSAGVPFDETTVPRPLAPYGHTRLVAEERFAEWAAATGTRVLVGRIANLYGPGANLGKPQGLVSQLAAAHLDGRPSSIYVPFETTRDYLYIDDAAAMIADGTDLVADSGAGSVTTKIFASQRGHSITEVIEAVGAAVGEELDIRTGEHASASRQGLDLRFRSTVLTELDHRVLVPFDEGVRRTVDAIRHA